MCGSVPDVPGFSRSKFSRLLLLHRPCGVGAGNLATLPQWWNPSPGGLHLPWVVRGPSPSVHRQCFVERWPQCIVAGAADIDKNSGAVFNPMPAASRRSARTSSCNGGSPSSYQALAAGKPVLGIASNLDQLSQHAFRRSMRRRHNHAQRRLPGRPPGLVKAALCRNQASKPGSTTAR